MATKFLTGGGLSHLWNRIKSLINNKVDWSAQRRLGAFNILPMTISGSHTINGVSYSRGSAGTVNIYGTATENTDITIYEPDKFYDDDNVYLKNMVLSGDFKFVIECSSDIKDITVTIQSKNGVGGGQYDYVVIPVESDPALKKTAVIDGTQIIGQYIKNIFITVPADHNFGTFVSSSIISFMIAPTGTNMDFIEYSDTNALLTKKISAVSGLIDDTITDLNKTWSSDKIDSEITRKAIEKVDWESYVKLGAKNLLPKPTLTNGSSGTLTWTVNEDGSITLNGTAETNETLTIFSSNLDIHTLFNELGVKLSIKATENVFSNEKISNVYGTLTYYDNTTTPPSPGMSMWFTAMGLDSDITEKEFEPLEESSSCEYVDSFNYSIDIVQGSTFNNVTLYPMLMIIDDTNYTYSEYALTNKQLTEKFDDVVGTTTFSVSTTDWVNDTTSQSGVTLKKKQIPVNNIYVDRPAVDIGCAPGSVLPTSAQQTAYDLLKYATVDAEVPCLYLYATAVPSTAYYILVEGCD